MDIDLCYAEMRDESRGLAEQSQSAVNLLRWYVYQTRPLTANERARVEQAEILLCKLIDAMDGE